MSHTTTRHITDLPTFEELAQRAIVDRSGFEMVPVLVRLREPGVPAEALWATPVKTDDDGSGMYVVRNNALLAALVVGDIVQAERGADSHLHVTGAARLSEGPLTEVHCPEDAPDGLVAETMEAWYEGGALFTQQYPGVLLTAWPDSMVPAAVLDVMESTGPPGWALWDITTAMQRAVQLINDVDFTVSPTSSAPER